MIASKVANALVDDAPLRGGVSAVLDVAGAAGSVESTLAAFKKFYGGVWVGGRVVLTEDAVTFAPNRLNRSVQSGLSTIAVDLDTIAGVEVLPGFLTKIISLDTPGHRLKIRCFGARALAERIRAAVAGRGGS